jgi:superfamily II DNA or RNA helicase
VQLRPYQTEVVNSVYRAVNEGHKRIAVVAGTAAGKTWISAAICSDAVSAGTKVMFLVHLDVLVEQTADKLKKFDLEVGYIKSGFAESPEASLQICSIQTLNNREWWKDYPAELVIFDEAHISMLSQVGKQIILETHPNAVVLALTATPERLSGEQLGDYCTALVASPTPSELQEQGFLSELVYLVPNSETIDVSKFTIKGEDYDQEEIKNACDQKELIVAAVREWMTPKETSRGLIDCRGKRTLAFCVDIAHANRVANTFNYVAKQFPDAFNGIEDPFVCVTGETTRDARRQIYQDFRDGKILGISSCNVISIGFDEPAAEVGLMLRPTASTALWLQMVGRLMRISPETGKKFGILLDQAANSTRLILPEKIEQYHLPVSTEKGTRPAPMKVCPECDKLNYAFTTSCTCGHIWISKKEINTNGLVELPQNKVYKVDELKRRFSEYRKLTFIEGLDPFEAERRFAKDFGISPIDTWYQYSTLNPEITGEEKKRWLEHYLQYLCNWAAKSGKPEEWVLEQLTKEGVAA